MEEAGHGARGGRKEPTQERSVSFFSGALIPR